MILMYVFFLRITSTLELIHFLHGNSSVIFRYINIKCVVVSCIWLLASCRVDKQKSYVKLNCVC